LDRPRRFLGNHARPSLCPGVPKSCGLDSLGMCPLAPLAVTVMAVTLSGTTKLCAAPVNSKVFECFLWSGTCGTAPGAPIGGCDPPHAASIAAAAQMHNAQRPKSKFFILPCSPTSTDQRLGTFGAGPQFHRNSCRANAASVATKCGGVHWASSLKRAIGSLIRDRVASRSTSESRRTKEVCGLGSL